MKKKTKISKKLLYGLVIPLFAIMLVSAGILTYYGQVKSIIDVEQQIVFTVDNVDKTGVPATEDVECDAGETCIGTLPYRVINKGESDKTVALVVSGNTNEIDVDYVGKLELTKKNSTWGAIGNPIELTYTVVGETFEFSGVPEGYTLIYYKDEVVGLDNRTANPQPAIIVISNIGSLPQNNDVNKELENYCQDPDNYEHCNGAKLWIVPNGDLNGGTLSWANMFNGYYYETDLIQYFDNANGEITIPAGSYIEFYPQFSVNDMATTENYVVYTTINPIV